MKEGEHVLTREQKIDVVDELVCYFSPIADSAYDGKAYERQVDAEFVFDAILSDFIEVARQYKSPFGSVEKAGKRALTFLIDMRDEIDDVIKELQEEGKE